MRESVAIIGGGVAGLTAAHELVERGYQVTVYERRPWCGGKAASYRFEAASASAPGLDDLPGEHGFRFFPGWYRHLIDTMERIPFYRAGGGRGTVAANLVSVESNLLAWFTRAPLTLPVRMPQNRSEAAAAADFVSELRRLGLSAGEMSLFLRKLLEFLAVPDERRAERFEGMSWWQFLECGHPERSAAYRDLVRASTRTMVAAKAEEASAYTIGRLAVRTLLDTLSAFDRVLNGPTSEVWIDPWVAYLESRGVEFVRGVELSALDVAPTGTRIKRARFESVSAVNARRLLRSFASGLRSPAEKGRRRRLWKQLHEDGWLQPRNPSAGSSCLRTALRAAELSTPPAAEADFFVLALPLEQLAYYVNRSVMLTHLAPELRRVLRLTRHMDWMVGMQFFLRKPLDIAPGHLVGMDSAWALTAIEQTQFWKDVPLDPAIKAVLSVDIAAWERRGRTIRKEAFNCSPQEIATEVWSQLQEMLNKPGRPALLRDDMLLGGKLTANHSFHLDENLIDCFDRKKQAFYERARGVGFSTVELIDDDTTEEAADPMPVATNLSYMWGPQRDINTEPLLVNRAGSRALRPDVRTSIPNLFLAGDFVRTDTDLACMEGANEAARLAVNALLEASNSREAPCRTWTFSPSRRLAESALAALGVFRGLGRAVEMVSRVQDGLWKGFANGVSNLTRGAALGRTGTRSDDSETRGS